MQQLLDPVFFPRTVDVGNLILWEAAEKLVYLGGCGGRERTIETSGELGCSGMVGPYFSLLLGITSNLMVINFIN